MKFSAAAIVLAASATFAAPVVEAPTQGALFRRELNARGLTDGDILNFALTLEHLEDTFYKLGLSMFPQAAYDAVKAVPRLRFNIQEISNDESTHVTFLTGALKAAGVTPVEACTYSFGLTDVKSFITTANILEGVGVSAYLGAAAAIAEPAYLTAAGSILTVEARHNAYLRDNQMVPGPQSPFPAAFDIPLDPNQVYTLASAFITACPKSNPVLPFTAFPSLSYGPLNPYIARPGSLIGLQAKVPVTQAASTLSCAWPNVAGTVYTKVTEIDQGGKRVKCTIPTTGVTGQAYVVLTTSPDALADDNTVAGPAIVQVQAPYTYSGFPQ